MNKKQLDMLSSSIAFLRNVLKDTLLSVDELRDCINSDRYVPLELNSHINKQLEYIGIVQEKITREYQDLICLDLPDTITETENIVEDYVRKNDKIYQNSLILNRFLRLYSDNEKINGLLNVYTEKVKMLLNRDDIESLDYIETFGSITNMLNILDEQDDRKRFDLILKCKEIENDLKYELAFNKIRIKPEIESNDSETNDNINEISITKDESCDKLDDLVEKEQLTDNGQADVEEVLPEVPENIHQYLGMIQDFDYPMQATIDKKAKTKIKVKEFKSDIMKNVAKMAGMCDLYHNTGYSLYGFPPSEADLKEKMKVGLDSLLKNGYVEKYQVYDDEPVYYLSERGCSVFDKKECVELLNKVSKSNYNHKKITKIDVRSNTVMAHKMLYELRGYLASLVENTDDLEFASYTRKDYVLFSIEGLFEENLLLSSFMLKTQQELDDYKDILDYLFTEKDYTVIVEGLNKEHAKACATWLHDNFSDKKVMYKVYQKDDVYDVENDEVVDLKELLKEQIDENDDQDCSGLTTSESNEENIELSSVQEDVETEVEEIKEESVVEENVEINNEEDTDTVSQENQTSNHVIFNKVAEATHNVVGKVKEVLSEAEKNYYKSKKNILFQFLSGEQFYAALAYAKCLSEKNEEFKNWYNQLSYALDEPLLEKEYISDQLFVEFINKDSYNNFCLISSVIRNYLYHKNGYDYSVNVLKGAIENNVLFKTFPSLKDLVFRLYDFKNKYKIGIDKYADYRQKDKKRYENRLNQLSHEAKELYNNYIKGVKKENIPNLRVIETKKQIFSPDNFIAQCLLIVSSQDDSKLNDLNEILQILLIKENKFDDICSASIDESKIDKMIDDAWDDCGNIMKEIKKSRKLEGSLRNNLRKCILKIGQVLCDYAELKNEVGIKENDSLVVVYQKNKGELIKSIDITLEDLDCISHSNLEYYGASRVLKHTVLELKERLQGSFNELSKRYFYMDFLKDDFVLLDEQYKPILADIRIIEDMSVLKRIENYLNTPYTDWNNRLKKIYSGQDDYGSAALILNYMKNCGIELNDELANIEDWEDTDKLVESTKDKREDFIGEVELAQSYGQMNNAKTNEVEMDFKEYILSCMEKCYEQTLENKNYGYFSMLIEKIKNKISEFSTYNQNQLTRQLDEYIIENKNDLKNEIKAQVVQEIKNRIQKKNIAAAEDLLNRLISNDIDGDMELNVNSYLEDFFDEYSILYRQVSSVNSTLQNSFRIFRINKDTKGGDKLIQSWPGNAVPYPQGNDRMKEFLTSLGFNVETVERQKNMNNAYPNYNITLQSPTNGRKSNFKHPIAAFGSDATRNGFRVITLHGKFDSKRIIEICNEIGSAKNTLILIDCALTLTDRRDLAYLSKKNLTNHHVFAFLDRVAVAYLAKKYVAQEISRMLMAITMPFTYYQPYVYKSSDIMPQEIFMGRKKELEAIESPRGVNIVYGGRQLGKSALLRMAKKDINRDESNNRAIIVDIKGLDYLTAAKTIGRALYNENILKEPFESDDWLELSAALSRRLLDEEDRIPYLLLMLDEADAFIESCEAVNYMPFDRLKDIQLIGEERFKFVVAGLRNIVRFKKEVALGNNSSLAQLDSITIKPFKSLEARELLEIPLHYLGFRFDHDDPETEVLISTILGTTNYFPGLIQLYCKKLIESTTKSYGGFEVSNTPPYVIKKDHIKKVLADRSLVEDIRDKFLITLKVDEDDYYYILALLIAHLLLEDKTVEPCTSARILDLAAQLDIKKISILDDKKITALLDEMHELNVLQQVSDNGYRFTRNSFLEMMGSFEEIDDALSNYME